MTRNVSLTLSAAGINERLPRILSWNQHRFRSGVEIVDQ